MTLDGFCDHTATIADDEIHQHYTELLKNADTILFGRITYQLMEYWPTVVKNPTGNRSIDEFAVIIDNINKIVFSNTLKNVEWKNTRLAERSIEEEIAALRQQDGNDILIGSRSLIVTLLNLGLIEEFQLCIHPVIAGKGLPLFENIRDRVMLRLLKIKKFDCGAITFYYEPANK